MEPKQINRLGMKLDEWKHKSCIAHFGIGDDWATLYDIESSQESKGHATELLLGAKRFYQSQDKRIMGSVALNQRMSNLYKKVGIYESR